MGLLGGELDVRGADFRGRLAAEDLQEHVRLAFFVVNAVDKSFESHEGPAGDADAVVDREGLGDAAAGFLVDLDVFLDVVHFFFGHRGDVQNLAILAAGDGADEVTHAGDGANFLVNIRIQDSVHRGHFDFDERVAREDELVKRDFLAEAVVFLEGFLGNDNFLDFRDPLAKGIASALFLSRQNGQREPLGTFVGVS